MDKQKIRWIQATRGFAIILIMVSHCSIILNEYGSNIFRYLGAFGVELFIIVAGYLEYYNRNRKKDVIKVIRKIYPLYFLTLLAAVPLSVNNISDCFKQGFISSFLINALTLQSWIPDESYYFSFNSVSWYVSLVILYAFITSLVVKRYEQISKKKSVIILFLLFVLQIIWLIAFKSISRAHWVIYVFPLIRIIDFCYGITICKCLENGKKERDIAKYTNIGMTVWMLMIAILIVLSMNSNSETFLVVAWTIPSMLVLVLLSVEDERFITKIFRNNKTLIFIGNISFELFILHHLIIRYCRTISAKAGLGIHWWNYVIAIFLSFVLSYLFYGMRKKRFTLNNTN